MENQELNHTKKKEANSMAPKIIVIEGPDGAGKSTIAEGLCLKLTSKGYVCNNVHSPGATSVGKSIADIIYSDTSSRKAASFLYMADFAQLSDELRNSSFDYVVMDRHSRFSELVYSGMIDDQQKAQLMHDIYFNYMECSVPSYTYILNIPYEVACARIVEASRFNNYLDSKFVNDTEWGSKITNRYNKLINYGGILASDEADGNKWIEYNPDDWVEELYSNLAKAGLVA